MPNDPVRKPLPIAFAALTLLLGVVLMVYGFPAVLEQLRAMGSGDSTEGAVGRAGVGLIGLFLTFVGIRAVVRSLRKP